MNKNKYFILTFTLLGCLITPTCFAFFCPTNFNQIDYGSSPTQVLQQCGKPDSEQKSVKKNENVPQEWTYFIGQAVATGPAAAYQTTGTLKTTIDFDAQGYAINISVNGIGVGATSICGPLIALKSTRDEVKRACGPANFINKQTPAKTNGEDDIKVTEFIYNTNPPSTLVFENGVLTEKK